MALVCQRKILHIHKVWSDCKIEVKRVDKCQGGNFFPLFVHEGKERWRSLNKTGEVFFCWKRVEAKESNLLLVVVSTRQTLFLNVKNRVCLSV